MKNLKQYFTTGLVAIVSALSLAACKDHSTPTAVIGLAAEAAVANDLNAFVSTLTGQALADYGHASGLATLRARIGGENLSLGSTVQTSTFNCGKTCQQNSYSVAIVGSASLSKADVNCTSTYTQQRKTGFWHKSTHCWIADLN